MAERTLKLETGRFIEPLVYQTTTIELGKMVSINATGYAIEGVLTAGTACIGVARETADNSAGASGDITVEVETGQAAWMDNSVANAIAITDIGHSCYVEDDETIRAYVGGGVNVRAGRVLAYNATDGVLVYFDTSAGDVYVAGDLLIGNDLDVANDLGVVNDLDVGNDLDVAGATTCVGLAASGNITCVDVDPTGDISLDAGKALNMAPTGIMIGPYDETTTGGAPSQAEMVAAFGAATDGGLGVMFDDTPGVAYFCYAEETTGWYYCTATVGAP